MGPRSLLLLALAVSLHLAACGARETPAPFEGYDGAGRAMGDLPVTVRKPNLVVLVVDALRADALTSERMPFLHALAGQGVAFADTTSPAPWTLPSLTSLLTGLRPSRHGMNRMEARLRLPDSVATFAEVLQGSYGYETAALYDGPWFSGDGASVLQGFSYVKKGFTLQDVPAQIDAWNRVRDPDRPFFLFLHTYDAHDPYGEWNHPFPPRPAAPGPFGLSRTAMRDPKVVTRSTFLDLELSNHLQRTLGRDRYFDVLFRYIGADYALDPDFALAGELEAAYWDGVRWTDGLLERTHAYLERAGLLRDTLLVVTADHGESFGEHGFLGHGRNLFDEVIRIPLVAVGPPPFDAGRRAEGPVGLIDVLPTFLAHAGMEPLEGIDGRSVLPLARGEPMPCRAVIAEERLTYPNMRRDMDVVLLAARTPQWKYVLHYDVRSGMVREEAYDLANDPEELLDLAGEDGLLTDRAFEPCLCDAVGRLRELIWAAEDPDATGAPPPGDDGAHPRTPVPTPCNATGQ